MVIFITVLMEVVVHGRWCIYIYIFLIHVAQLKWSVTAFSFYVKGKTEFQRSKITQLVKPWSAGSQPSKPGEPAFRAGPCPGKSSKKNTTQGAGTEAWRQLKLVPSFWASAEHTLKCWALVVSPPPLFWNGVKDAELWNWKETDFTRMSSAGKRWDARQRRRPLTRLCYSECGVVSNACSIHSPIVYHLTGQWLLPQQRLKVWTHAAP